MRDEFNDDAVITVDQALEDAAMILNVPEIHDETLGLQASVSVFNLKSVLKEAYQAGVRAGLQRAIDIHDKVHQ